jgi:hypothetical protein
MTLPRPLLRLLVIAVLVSGVIYFGRSGSTTRFDGDDVDLEGRYVQVARRASDVEISETMEFKSTSGPPPRDLLIDTSVTSPKKLSKETTSTKDNSPSTRFPKSNKPNLFHPRPNHPSTNPNSQYSYIFSADSAESLCSVLINIHILRDTFSSPHNITLLHDTEILPSYISLLDNYDVNTIRLAPEDNDRQIQVFAAGLTNFRRVVILNCDTLVFKPLDHLFEIPMHKPIMYPSTPSTLLMQPSSRLVQTLQTTPGKFPISDPLPPTYAISMSIFEQNESPAYRPSSVTTLDALWTLYRHETHVLQFASLKPWMSSNIGRFVDLKRKDAHPAFRRGFERWWELKKGICPPRGRDGFMREMTISRLDESQKTGGTRVVKNEITSGDGGEVEEDGGRGRRDDVAGDSGARAGGAVVVGAGLRGKAKGFEEARQLQELSELRMEEQKNELERLRRATNTKIMRVEGN